jgi:glycosyltransferase involved in cell wall biosynthesis
VLWLDQQMARTASILVPTAATRASYMARGVPAESLHVLPDSIDVGRFEQLDRRAARSHIRHELGLGEFETVIGTICRLEPVKNLPVLIEAVAGLPARLVIVGEGSERARLAGLIAAKGLAGQVLLTGRRGDVPELLAAFDLFVLASHSETFGIVVAEALLMGTPVVATSVGGIPDITGEGAYAQLVPPGDPQALAEALRAVIEQPGLLRVKAQAGQAYVRNAFAVGVVAQALHGVYVKVAAGLTIEES